MCTALQCPFRECMPYSSRAHAASSQLLSVFVMQLHNHFHFLEHAFQELAPSDCPEEGNGPLVWCTCGTNGVL